MRGYTSESTLLYRQRAAHRKPERADPRLRIWALAPSKFASEDDRIQKERVEYKPFKDNVFLVAIKIELFFSINRACLRNWNKRLNFETQLKVRRQKYNVNQFVLLSALAPGKSEIHPMTDKRNNTITFEIDVREKTTKLVFVPIYLLRRLCGELYMCVHTS